MPGEMDLRACRKLRGSGGLGGDAGRLENGWRRPGLKRGLCARRSENPDDLLERIRAVAHEKIVYQGSGMGPGCTRAGERAGTTTLQTLLFLRLAANAPAAMRLDFLRIRAIQHFCRIVQGYVFTVHGNVGGRPVLVGKIVLHKLVNGPAARFEFCMTFGCSPLAQRVAGRPMGSCITRTG